MSMASTQVTGVSLDAAQRTLFRGDQREQLRLEPRGRGVLALPVTVLYTDLYDLARELWTGRNRRQVGYTLRAGLSFEALVAGGPRVPVEARGNLSLAC